MIPEKLAERLEELSQDPDAIYSMRTRKAFLSPGKEKVPWFTQASYDGAGYQFDPISAVPVIALSLENGNKVLDMCAAPGTKTVLISRIADVDLTANDISYNRILRLKENLERYNVGAKITNVSGRIIEDKFDKILLDAPCSGEGVVNKKDKMFKTWSERRIRFLSKKQKKLIKNAFDILNNNGILIYSTCTFAPEENEEVVQFLLDKNQNAELENIEIKNLNYSNGLSEWKGGKFSPEMKKCLRIWPQHNATAGFFVARILKK